jgi:hypothetical protein
MPIKSPRLPPVFLGAVLRVTPDIEETSVCEFLLANAIHPEFLWE